MEDPGWRRAPIVRQRWGGDQIASSVHVAESSPRIRIRSHSGLKQIHFSPRLLLVSAATAGVAMEISIPGIRRWLLSHSFTTGILVGSLLILATYLVVETALETRERRRWTEAARPLLRAIEAAARGTDAQVRAASAAGAGAGAHGSEQLEWLGQLLERYQAPLTGTPDLIEHWHAALSLAQHARAAERSVPVTIDDRYEGCWRRFEATFADVERGRE